MQVQMMRVWGEGLRGLKGLDCLNQSHSLLLLHSFSLALLTCKGDSDNGPLALVLSAYVCIKGINYASTHFRVCIAFPWKLFSIG